jgi:hypothetical protein
MNNHRWGALGLLAGCVVLLICGVYVLGFLGEPSAVGRMRTALELIGGVLILAGAVAAFFGVRMLVARRT